MKAEIEHGYLFLIPESKTEEFAVERWFEIQEYNGCTGELKTKYLQCKIYQSKKTIKQRFQLWLLNHGLYDKSK